MTDESRPVLGLERTREPVESFIRELQVAIDTGDADRFNRRFAQDVLWGSPFGAVAVGYDQIHALPAPWCASVGPSPGAARYTVEHVLIPADGVALAYVRRASARPGGDIDPR